MRAGGGTVLLRGEKPRTAAYIFAKIGIFLIR